MICHNNCQKAHEGMLNNKTVVIVGAGPAGLTAALELLNKTGVKPVVFESSNQVGGISKTVNYKGNRIDIGGHRFFSKSDVVMDWWNEVLPLQDRGISSTVINYHNNSKQLSLNTKFTYSNNGNVMLIRRRQSRIYYDGKFFDYPLTLNVRTLRNLGLSKLCLAGISYAKALMFPRKPEVSLEDFLINRFGDNLYKTFFKEYTEKVWGVPCDQISAEWGAQRIKGLSVHKVLTHALKSSMSFLKSQDYQQKNIETSLIEQFLYPKYGPGQLWERVAETIREKGGEIHLNTPVVSWNNKQKIIKSVTVLDKKTNKKTIHKADYFISSVAIKNLVTNFNGNPVPLQVKKIATSLEYRDFITVGVLIGKINKQTKLSVGGRLVDDNWIYIQEPGLKVGRVQIFNNWSPALVKNPKNIWLGLEYFVNEGDDLWLMKDSQIKKFAINELQKLEFVQQKDVIDSVVVRVKKAYPGYFGAYRDFDVVQRYLDKYQNLFLVGRNGMHRYNNQDHSMLTAMRAVYNIINGVLDKKNIWDINTEEDYHEIKNI